MRRSVPALLAGLLVGAAIGLSMPARGNDDAPLSLSDLLFARAEFTLWSLQNIVVSLAVDTERSAIEIARTNARIAALERRLSALETGKGSE